MKTFLKLAIVALVATVLTSSCEKKPKDPVFEAQIATYSEDWGSGMDQWVYTYNTEGKVTGVVRNWVENSNPVKDKEWNFAWAGNKLTITGSNNYEITFGANGYASTMTESGSDWAETYAYTYDANGYLISISRDGDLRSEITIENGNIKTWTRKSDDVWQTKNHTYSTVENKAGIYAIYSERGGASRWLQELGYFGKPCKNLCSSNQWTHSEKASSLTYDFDTNNNVTKVTKTYDGDNEISIYTWNMIEVAEE